VRAQPAERSGRRLRSAWVLLSRVAPELAEWAAFFAAGAGKRAAAEAGLGRAVSQREADDLVRAVQTFLTLCMAAAGAGGPGQAVARAG
jgi:SAV_6107-like HEPN